MFYDVLTDPDVLWSLEDEWAALQERWGSSPFTGPVMAKTWWDVVGCPFGFGLVVVLAREDDGRLVGLLPLTVQKTRGVRILRLLGNDVYYYKAFLAETPAIAQTLWAKALALPVFDLAAVKNVHDGTELYDFFRARAPVFRSTSVFSRQYVGEDEASFLAGRSSVFRRRFKKFSALLAPDGAFSFGWAREEEWPQDVLAFLLRRKAQWARERGARGPFTQEDVTVNFFRVLSEVMRARGLAALFWIRHKGEPVAAFLSFLEKKTIFGQMITFDPAFARHSPGVFLLVKHFLWALAQGYEETNFMEGEEEFKRSLANACATSHEFLCARTWRGRVYLWAYKGLNLLRTYRLRKKQPAV